MVEASGNPCLAADLRDVIAVDGRAAQDLDGDITAQPRVVGAIHVTHAARAEQPENSVRSEALAGRERSRRILRFWLRLSHV